MHFVVSSKVALLLIVNLLTLDLQLGSDLYLGLDMSMVPLRNPFKQCIRSEY